MAVETVRAPRMDLDMDVGDSRQKLLKMFPEEEGRRVSAGGAQRRVRLRGGPAWGRPWEPVSGEGSSRSCPIGGCPPRPL